MSETHPAPACPVCAEYAALNAFLRERLQDLEARLAAMEEQNAALRERLGMNSSNSHKPPSSDSPKDEAKRQEKQKKKKKRKRRLSPRSTSKRGGHQRTLLPVEEVDHLHACKPSACACCGLTLSGDDARPQRHQVTELPKTLYEVHEYQLHALSCTSCGHVTRGELPEGVTKSRFGPRLKAFMVLLTGIFSMSRREAADLLREMGIDVALGSVSKVEKQATAALEKPVDEVAQAARAAQVANADETGWKHKGERRWLWVLCFSAGALFMVQTKRDTKAAQKLLGEEFSGIVGCDRWGAYNWVSNDRKQLCWAHLDRDFESMAQAEHAEAKAVGMALMLATDAVFHFWWQVRGGTLSREDFAATVDESLRPHVRALLEAGSACGHKRTRGMCKHILKREAALWTFAYHEGIEPTNNVAERTIRRGALWRKRCFGSQSERGERFVERILSSARHPQAPSQERFHLSHTTLRGARKGLASSCHSRRRIVFSLRSLGSHDPP